MLQKRNDFEIIEFLRKEPAHIRKIARELKLIPSTVMRLVKRLESELVLDVTYEGRNAKYFLKTTPEAKAYLFMVEEYRRIAWLNHPEFRMLFKNLIELTQGELIILFGSHVKGYAKKESDIDLFVETKSKALKEKIENISDKLSVHIGSLGSTSGFGREIINNHIILQNVARFYRLIQ
ncbi:MAG: nucleotidyltransferase domain-containing protein [Nanoarchaeota archaeon]